MDPISTTNADFYCRRMDPVGPVDSDYNLVMDIDGRDQLFPAIVPHFQSQFHPCAFHQQEWTNILDVKRGVERTGPFIQHNTQGRSHLPRYSRKGL